MRCLRRRLWARTGHIPQGASCIRAGDGLSLTLDFLRLEGGLVRRQSILRIWVGGLVLAVLLYAIGPDRFFDSFFGFYDRIEVVFHNLATILGAQVFSVARAAAIAIYIVFSILAFLASQRGHRGFGAWVTVTVLGAILVWRPFSEMPAEGSRWILALLLVVVGALTMTQRLMAAPPYHRSGPPPYPPGQRL